MILPEMRKIIIMNYEILSWSILPYLQIFANLSEHELNQLVEQKHSTLGHQNNNKLVCILNANFKTIWSVWNFGSKITVVNKRWLKCEEVGSTR